MQFCLKRIPDYSVCIIHYIMVVVSNKQVYIFFFSSFFQKLDKSAKPKNVFLQQVPYLKPWTKRSIRALISTSTPAGAGSETHPFPQVIQCGTGFRNCHTQIFIISKTYQVIRVEPTFVFICTPILVQPCFARDARFFHQFFFFAEYTHAQIFYIL